MEEELRLMDQFATFAEFLVTMPTFKDLKNKIGGKSDRRKNVEATFTANIQVRKRKLYTIPEIPEKWQEIVEPALTLIENSLTFVNEQIENGFTVYPPNNKLFRALELTSPKKVKVIIIGQDPYHSPKVANGLAFSCNGILQSSIQNIFKELKRTHGDCPNSGNLDFWAEQGVLLLNTCLTVNEGKAGSHGKAWDAAIIKILEEFFLLKRRVVVCLWGAKARMFFEKAKFSIAVNKTEILYAGHPSGINTKNPFIGSKTFKRIDKIFKKWELEPIDWIGK